MFTLGSVVGLFILIVIIVFVFRAPDSLKIQEPWRSILLCLLLLVLVCWLLGTFGVIPLGHPLSRY